MSWKFIQIDPMLAHGAYRDELLDDPDVLADVKHDGFRFIGQFCGDVVRFTTRRISKRTGKYQERTAQVPHLSGGAAALRIPQGLVRIPKGLDGTVIDCEIVPAKAHLAAVRAEGGAVSKAVGSIVGSDPVEAVRKQLERGWLRLAVFDCLWFSGRDLRGDPLKHRREMLKAVLGAWGNPHAFLSPGVVTGKREFYDLVTSKGEEGVVLKRLSDPYDGKPSRWVKRKEVWTADVVVTGVVAAKEMSVKKGDDEETATRYAKNGWIGGLSVGQYRNGKLVQVSNPKRGVSGFADDLRAEISRNPKRFIGKVMQIKHNGREPTGRFRHPRYDCFRDDKAPRECVWRREET